MNHGWPKSVFRVLPIAVLIGLCQPMGAVARNAFSSDVPNGLAFDCGSCHIDIDQALNLTWFGTDIALRYDDYDNPKPGWSDVYHLDSDGDGLSNGEELGDPCGVWEPGDEAQYEEVSNPGDDQGVLQDVPAYECETQADDDDSADGDEELTSCVYSVAGETTPTWPLCFMALWFLLRRRPPATRDQR